MNRAERRAEQKKLKALKAEEFNTNRFGSPDDLVSEYYKQRVQVADRLQRNGITLQELKDNYNRGYDAGVQYANKRVGLIMTAAMCEALKEMHGFGRKRLCDLAGRMCEIMTETFSTQEAIERVYKKTGLRFNASDPFNFLEFDD